MPVLDGDAKLDSETAAAMDTPLATALTTALTTPSRESST